MYCRDLLIITRQYYLKLLHKAKFVVWKTIIYLELLSNQKVIDKQIYQFGRLEYQQVLILSILLYDWWFIDDHLVTATLKCSMTQNLWCKKTQLFKFVSKTREIKK